MRAGRASPQMACRADSVDAATVHGMAVVSRNERDLDGKGVREVHPWAAHTAP